MIIMLCITRVTRTTCTLIIYIYIHIYIELCIYIHRVNNIGTYIILVSFFIFLIVENIRHGKSETLNMVYEVSAITEKLV